MKTIPFVNVGQRPRAADQNDIITAVNTLNNVFGGNGVDASITEGGVNVLGPSIGRLNLPVAQVIGLNSTEIDYSPGDIAAIDQSEMTLLDPYVRDRVMPVVLKEPESGDVGNWVVILEPIEAGASGPVATAGIVLATVRRLSANAAVELRHAEFTDGEAYLTMTPIGSARVIWEQTKDLDGASITLTDDHWALISFGYASPPLYAEATSAPSGGTLTVKLAGSDGTLYGSDITVYDGGIA